MSDILSVKRTWYRRLSKAQFDALIILSLSLPTYLFLRWAEAFDLVYAFTRAHEEWELDELIALFFVIGIASAVFGLRRLFDLRSEVKRRQVAEEEANKLARHDPLTGLPNRRHFLDEASRKMANLAPDQEGAVFIVDLDHFKAVNDLYGHRVGDIVLCEVATRLSEATEGEGMVARFGGDEFGIVMCCPRNGGMPERVARRIVHDISQPIIADALSMKVGASVGVTLASSHSGSEDVPVANGAAPERLHHHLRHADLAMYRAKIEGRGQYRFFEQEMDEKLKLHFRMKSELANAIASKQIVPYYQQLVDLTSREVTGYEVLARWRHPILGVIGPADFIPIAEDTGVISKLTISILRTGDRRGKEMAQSDLSVGECLPEAARRSLGGAGNIRDPKQIGFPALAS